MLQLRWLSYFTGTKKGLSIPLEFLAQIADTAPSYATAPILLHRFVPSLSFHYRGLGNIWNIKNLIPKQIYFPTFKCKTHGWALMTERVRGEQCSVPGCVTDLHDRYICVGFFFFFFSLKLKFKIQFQPSRFKIW